MFSCHINFMNWLVSFDTLFTIILRTSSYACVFILCMASDTVFGLFTVVLSVQELGLFILIIYIIMLKAYK